MSEEANPLAVMGALVAHAEALQAQAEAALKQARSEAEAQHLEVAGLTRDLAEVLKAFDGQRQAMQKQLQAFGQAIARIDSQAGAGGRAAVADEARAAFKSAGAAIGAAARDAVGPARERLVSGATAIEAARLSLVAAQKGFSWRALGMAGALIFMALVVAVSGGAGFVAWQRHEVESARQELADLQAKVASLTIVIAEMEKKGRDLDARGVRFETTQCLDSDKRRRLCVEIEPGTSSFYLDGGKKQFFVPKGF
ncbi:hypothetical protein K9U39_20650 [Rhodoblastus acidophilus]|uniref:Uncharacterized protein n=1 Tax=Candidatus Rhodoblastus alkanivorans TaxID=2954117 RepID=A0ABS9ZBY5_9HYPH|nr:hypothetical protein [Candidatus Rhodoblastus alkanivorans]MCI4680625.1 hypothetical protein [Candidatus Rhodoblastus alkanivorans]MCI4685031.1 hypothetical protein [Candidatus Rhodoblastus alkanivorans]MDI4643294.1 hypothetical protein [Rhodoblastus acidophilus]